MSINTGTLTVDIKGVGVEIDFWVIIVHVLGSCDRASLMQEKKEPTDDTGTDVYSQLVLSQHVSGIIMPIVRRTDCIKPRVVLAWMCWLLLCGVRIRAEHSTLGSCPNSTQPETEYPG